LQHSKAITALKQALCGRNFGTCHESGNQDTGHSRVQLSDVCPCSSGGVKLLGHGSAGNKQVVYLIVGEGAQRQEEGQWDLRWKAIIVLAAYNLVHIHVVEAKSHPVLEGSRRQLHIRDELSRDIFLLH